jgi:hypothetical protein
VVGVPATGLRLGDSGVTMGVPVVGATAMEANVGAPVAGDTKGLPGVTVGVPVVGALAVVVGVPVTGLTMGDPGVTVGVSVVGATEQEANVGASLAGDTGASRSHCGCSCVGSTGSCVGGSSDRADNSLHDNKIIVV